MTFLLRPRAPFEGLPYGEARCILADPPWYFANWSERGEGKNPTAHYECMPIEAIKALPVMDLADADGCACVIWATAPMLPEAIDTLRAWGFTFKSAGAWAKQSKTGRSFHFGTGYCYRSAAEFWVLGTIGDPAPQSRSIRNLIVAPVQQHSRKPALMRTMCEQLWAGPRIELFARERVQGWTPWGNGVPDEQIDAAADGLCA